MQSQPPSPAWHPSGIGLRVDVLLSEEAIAATDPSCWNLPGYDLRVWSSGAGVPPSPDLRNTSVVIVEGRPGSAEFLSGIQKLLKETPDLTVVAAVSEPTVDSVRTLMRAGAYDVLRLPLNIAEFQSTLDGIKEARGNANEGGGRTGKIISVVKSRGGSGATMLLTQLATYLSSSSREPGSRAAVIDLDLQFGNVASYLGQEPALGALDLLQAGHRLDAALLRTVALEHVSGLQVISAPKGMVPLDAVGADQVLALLDLAAAEFQTVFLDLPAAWTNWSLSALVKSDLVLLVTDLSISGIHQTADQISFFEEQGVASERIKVILNKVPKKMFRRVDAKAAEQALQRDLSIVIADDPMVPSALDLGNPIEKVAPKSAAARDLRALAGRLSTFLSEASNVAG
jgi:pilus assembly protein CpaE